MSISVTFNSAHRITLASRFFMTRRPVVDRQRGLAAHELLFCDIGDERAGIAANANANANANATATATDEPQASASVIADVCRHGLGRILGNRPGILYIDAEALMSDIFQLLAPQQLIFEIAVADATLPGVRERLAQLCEAGFSFAFVVRDESELTPETASLLHLAAGLRFSIGGKDAAAMRSFCDRFRGQGKRLLAEGVDTAEQFRQCTEAGFDLFQGYFFTEPQMVPGKGLSPTQITITELMALLASDADNAVIEHSIKADVSLGLNLLRLVNTAAISAHRIDSLRQALMALGRNQLQRWLQIMLYADAGGQPVALPLMEQAILRGRLMELVAQKLRPGNRSIADTAFTVGIMSLMDTLFSMPMESILRQIPAVDEVADALLQRQGYFGALLALVESTEWRQQAGPALLLQIGALKLSYQDLYLLQLAAFEWSDQVTRSLH